MIERGRERAARLRLENVDFALDDFAGLLHAGRGVYDAAICTMTLHDLASTQALDSALHAMAACAGSLGAVYIEDFARLKAAASIDFFVNLNAPAVADRFSGLYRCSLGAAFTFAELREGLRRRLPQVTLHQTFLVPFLIVAKTGDNALSGDQKRELALKRAALPEASRRDLDDLRRFFSLGGLRNDPFV